MANGNKMLDTTGKLSLASVIISIGTAAMIVWIGWLSDSVITLREFSARGERFTQADGLRLRREIVNDIKSELPPQWLLEDVKEIVQDHREFDRRIRGLEKQHP